MATEISNHPDAEYLCEDEDGRECVVRGYPVYGVSRSLITGKEFRSSSRAIYRLIDGEEVIITGDGTAFIRRDNSQLRIKEQRSLEP